MGPTASCKITCRTQQKALATQLQSLLCCVQQSNTSLLRCLFPQNTADFQTRDDFPGFQMGKPTSRAAQNSCVALWKYKISTTAQLPPIPSSPRWRVLPFTKYITCRPSQVSFFIYFSISALIETVVSLLSLSRPTQRYGNAGL